MLPKATSGYWGPCDDCRVPNNVTIPDRYPAPYLQDFSGALFGRAVFSKIPFDFKDIPQTAITSTFGHFEFIHMPFGLCNAAKTFQSFIDHGPQQRNNSRSVPCRFLPNCVDLMLPLTNMLSGLKNPLELTGDELTAFERIKASLADATLPTHPAPEAPLSVLVAVGAVLQKHLTESTRP
ncbi:hypothetical protein SprV_0602211500 [Sparganum proliferum]